MQLPNLITREFCLYSTDLHHQLVNYFRLPLKSFPSLMVCTQISSSFFLSAQWLCGTMALYTANYRTWCARIRHLALEETAHSVQLTFCFTLRIWILSCIFVIDFIYKNNELHFYECFFPNEHSWTCVWLGTVLQLVNLKDLYVKFTRQGANDLKRGEEKSLRMWTCKCRWSNQDLESLLI